LQQLAATKAPVDEVMQDTGTCQDADTRARVALIHGKTFLQCASLKYVTTTHRRLSYRLTDFKRDVQQGYIQPASHDQSSVFSVEEVQKILQQFETDANDLMESCFNIGQGSDPLNDTEALAGPDSAEWHAAIWKELNALIQLNCWEIKAKTCKPQNKKVYRSKLVLKSKPPANHQPGRKKARCVISDPKFLQKLQDVDCFSPMSRLETVRYLLSTAVERNWALCHTDVTNAFPNADLPEPVWMEVPKSMILEADKTDPAYAEILRNSYCYVTKALYGLGHSPRCFNKHLDKYFVDNGWVATDADACLYVKYNELQEPICAAATFVDDALVVGTPEACTDYRKFMAANFQISDLGEPTDFLGMQIHVDHKNNKIKLWQEKYIEKMCQRYNVVSKKTQVPMPYDQRLEPTTELDKKADAELFRSKLGSMMYASVCTRPDIAATMRELAKNMVNPSSKHMEAADQCLQYLCYTKDLGLTYEHGDYVSIEGKTIRNGQTEMFTDASWAEDLLTRTSTSGYAALKNKAAISWACKGQGKVALSSGDAELRALAECMREAAWLKKLISAFNPNPTVEKPNNQIQIWEDNKSCIKWIENPCAHQKVKHIDVPLKALRHAVTITKDFILSFIGTDRQIADVLTKALSPKKHWKLVGQLMNTEYSSQAVAARK
jgi:hypothetical protein